MLTALEAPHADTRADELSWVMGLQPLEALAVLPIDLRTASGPARLELRVLGASHQAILAGPQCACSETVACLPGHAAKLPGAVVENLDGATYSFSATVRRYPPVQFRGHVERLVHDVRERPDALAGTFPESPYAVTALAAETAGERLEWRSWHTYPAYPDAADGGDAEGAGGEIVVTRTEVIAG